MDQYSTIVPNSKSFKKFLHLLNCFNGSWPIPVVPSSLFHLQVYELCMVLYIAFTVCTQLCFKPFRRGGKVYYLKSLLDFSFPTYFLFIIIWHGLKKHFFKSFVGIDLLSIIFCQIKLLHYMVRVQVNECKPPARGRRFDSQPEGLGVAFFATGPGLGFIMYILTTLAFPTHYFNFHLLTTSVNAKYYY